MTKNEIAKLIMFAHATAGAEISTDVAEAQIQTWSDLLKPYFYDDCYNAILEHYKTSRLVCRPYDIIARMPRSLSSRIQPCGNYDCICSHTFPCVYGWDETIDDGKARPCQICRPQLYLKLQTRNSVS